MNRGRLISLDGVDGAGKSTQATRLVRELSARGHRVLATREPTDGAWGRRIRDAAHSGVAPAPADELEWFMADRREHVDRVIAPALARGEIVVTDRYYLSTVAYQGARGIPFETILDRSEREFPWPDLALLMTIDARAGLARAASRGGPADPLFEEEGFLRRVARIFDTIERAYVVRVDAGRDEETVAAALRGAIDDRLGLFDVASDRAR